MGSDGKKLDPDFIFYSETQNTSAVDRYANAHEL